MARGRMLNKKISQSNQLNLLPDDTCRLLATWCIAHLDMNGVFHGDPLLVRSIVLPWRADITLEQMSYYLQEMQRVGLIIIFEARGQQWQYWPGFVANQINLRSDRESTDYPPPPTTPPTPQTPPPPAPAKKEPTPTPQPAQPVPATIPPIAGNLPENIRPNLKESKLIESNLKGGESNRVAQPAYEVDTTPQSPPLQKNINGLHRKKTDPGLGPPPKPQPIPAYKTWVDNGLSCGIHPLDIALLDKTIGRAPPELELFGKICAAWRSKGWKKTNVNGVLDYFNRREIPGHPNKPNGVKNGYNRYATADTAPPSRAAGLGEWTAADIAAFRAAGIPWPDDHQSNNQLPGRNVETAA